MLNFLGKTISGIGILPNFIALIRTKLSRVSTYHNMRLILTSILILASVMVFGQKMPEQPGGNERNEVRKVSFFPNPATTFITFEFKEPIKRGTQIQVFSFLGRQVKNIQATAQKMTVNISDLNRGIYVFQVRDPSGRIVESNKFQIAQ